MNMKTRIFVLALLFGCLLSGNLFAQRVTNGSYQMVANIKSDGTIQDSNYRTIAHIKSDGTVQDGSYRTIGHINNGTVKDSNYRSIGHADGVPMKWAAYYFFFLK